MNKYKKILLGTLLSLSFGSTFAAEDNQPYTVPLDPVDDIDPDKGHNNHGNRMPAKRTIICVITAEGIQSAIDPASILAYELWDEDEVCLVSTPDEASFLDVFYSLKGDVTLRIVTEEYIYVGYLSL